MAGPNDIQHIQPSDRISQAPSQLQQIFLQILSHCAGTAFPTTDNSPGRLAFILDDAASPAGYKGWLCMYKGLDSSNAPIWNKVININDLPATLQQLTDVANAKQDKITGAASTLLTAQLTASRVLASDASGKVSITDVGLALFQAAMASFDSTKGSIQSQLNGKQPNIIASTADPTPADAVGKPDGTVWLTYVP